MYDAIVIGSRCAGAPTAMLLARLGRRVLVVDRATFPRDVLSGHTIQPAGMAQLARWGLLERVRATGAPFVSHIRFDFGDVVLEGSPSPADGIDAAACVRRTVLDPLLADAAAEAGAEVRHGVTVTELVRDGDRVVGIRGYDSAGHLFDERASIVVGADGVNSFVARSVDAATYHVQPATTFAVYSYWRGLDPDRFELYTRPGRFFVATPTNGGLTLVAQQVPIADAARYHGRTADAFADSLAEVPRLAAKVARGERVERFRRARTHDGFFRQPAGPGWALVGDAGYHKDPITAQGMLDAFRDAELLAGAIDAGLDGKMAPAMLRYQRERDAGAMPMYELTCGLADLDAPPSDEIRGLLAAIEGQPVHIARFLGLIAGSVPVAEFFSPDNLAAIAGTTLAAA